MKNFTIKLSLLLFLGTGSRALGWTADESITRNDADTVEVVKGNTQFALGLYAQLPGQNSNLFFSPFSLSTALAMTYAGARDRTAKQIASVLHFILDQQRLHPAFAALSNELSNDDKSQGYQLYIANALWGQQGYGFLKDFLLITKAHYRAGLSEVDFRQATEAARTTINTWVEQQTQEKIKELLKPGLLNQDTRLVLTNAIYFKGKWASPFKKEQTQSEAFQVTATQKVTVPMMHQRGAFKYLDEDDFQALELPYVGEKLSMVVFLPKAGKGLAIFEKSLTAEKLAKWLAKLHHQEVEVIFPHFKTTTEFELSQVLSKMGMPLAFKEAADFSGMDGKKDLYISKVVHKAYVDVNEEGTEAAASTGVVMGLRGLAPSPVFRADRPFVFLIQDIRSGSVLFLGRVTNPRE